MGCLSENRDLSEAVPIMRIRSCLLLDGDVGHWIVVSESLA